MLDSLELFEEISHNGFLENTECILFLNKHDLFVEKLKTSNLSSCFPDYDGKRFHFYKGGVRSSSCKVSHKTFHKLLGNFSYFEQLFPLRATCFLSSNLLHFEQFPDRRSPKINQVLFKGQYERFRRLTKFAEDFRFNAHSALKHYKLVSKHDVIDILAIFLS